MNDNVIEQGNVTRGNIGRTIFRIFPFSLSLFFLIFVCGNVNEKV